MKIQQVIDGAEIIVVKVGTALVVSTSDNTIKSNWLNALADDIKVLVEFGKHVVIVSSGAVALGRKALGIDLKTAPKAIPLEKKQAASAVGQYHLFHNYHAAFAGQDLKLAQVLLTMSETENRRMHLNARATLNTLLEAGIIPVINENDTISTGEIRFGDNDRLAARVAQMIEADCVVLLSTTDGLYTANPDKDPKAVHIPLVATIEDKHLKMAGEAVPGLSTGGMKSKIEAAKAATQAGIHLIIGNGQDDHALKRIIENENCKTTLFTAQTGKKTAKQRWLHAHLRPKGSITLDKGAVAALKSGKSLLPVGVSAIEGVFERGDVVEIKSPEGVRLGMGICAYDDGDARKIIGKNSQEIITILGYAGRSELIHRNDMVLQD